MIEECCLQMFVSWLVTFYRLNVKQKMVTDEHP